MKALSESEVQEIANKCGCIITGDKDGFLKMWGCTAHPTPWHIGKWVNILPDSVYLNIRVLSDKPWDEQKWEPKKE